MHETDPETREPNHAAAIEAIRRCAQAYDHVRSQLPSGASQDQDWENHADAGRAFLAALPVLYGPESYQIYLACVAQAVSLGVIDPIDIGRYCHMVQTAASVWRLAHPPVQLSREKPAQEKQAPLPTRSNPDDSYSGADIAALLPDRETQTKLMKQLIKRGIPVPAESDLRRNPLVALYFCDLARNHMEKLPPQTGPSSPTGPNGAAPLLQQAG